jgi:hypothetical protein
VVVCEGGRESVSLEKDAKRERIEQLFEGIYPTTTKIID